MYLHTAPLGTLAAGPEVYMTGRSYIYFNSLYFNIQSTSSTHQHKFHLQLAFIKQLDKKHHFTPPSRVG